MRQTKILFSIMLAAIFLATQIMAVGAAPASQETTPITGVVESITLETDAETGEILVAVLLSDGMGGTQTVRLSLEDAKTLGLVTDEGEPVDPATIVDPLVIDPTLVIPETDEEAEEQAEHPVGSALSDFFSELLGVDYDTVMGYHDDGAGFGVIAQALWMTNALDGDSDMFAVIMDAKLNNDFSAITLPDGSEPQNWGQFRKAVMHDREKSKENLGAIMSGRADNNPEEVPPLDDQIQGNGNNPDKDKSNNGKGPDKDKSNNGKNDNGNNKNKDKDKGKND
jgi:hypothetical protein